MDWKCILKKWLGPTLAECQPSKSPVSQILVWMVVVANCALSWWVFSMFDLTEKEELFIVCPSLYRGASLFIVIHLWCFTFYFAFPQSALICRHAARGVQVTVFINWLLCLLNGIL